MSKSKALAILALGSWLVAVTAREERIWIPDTGCIRNTLHNRNGRKAPLMETNLLLFACSFLLIR